MKFQLSLLTLLCFIVCLKSQNVTEVHLGDTVSIHCKPISDNPNVATTYEWFDPQNKHRGSNVNLIIPNFSYENEGVYTCKATQDNNGQTVSNQKSINVQIRKYANNGDVPFGVLVTPNRYNTFVSGIIFLKCKPMDGKSENYKIQWITPSGEIKENNNYFQNKVVLSDSGRYICRMTRISDGKVSENFTAVDVNKLPMIVEKESGSFEIGQNIILKCGINKTQISNIVYGVFNYSWEDPTGKEISTNKYINIKLDEKTPVGMYQCRLSSTSQSPPYSQTEKIEIRTAQNSVIGGRISGSSVPKFEGKFISQPSPFSFFETLDLLCQINPALPGATYKIFFKGQLLTNSNTYRIPHLDKPNIGEYTCNIAGKHEPTGQDINLKTTYSIQPEFQNATKIELGKPPGPKFFVHVGEKKELHCEIESNSGLSGKDAVWFFKGKEINTNEYDKYNIQVMPRVLVSMLVLKNIQDNNQGNYECKVRGVIKEAYIIVMAKGKHIELNPSNETRKGKTRYRPVEFHCRIDGYDSKNKDIIWTFMSSETGQVTVLDSRWVRSDDDTADLTSFISVERPEVKDTGTYICTEPKTGDTARATLNVNDGDSVVLSVSPRFVKLRAGQDAKFKCSFSNPGRNPDYPDFFMGNGSFAAVNQRVIIERLEPGNVQLTYKTVSTNDNGTTFTCKQGGLSENVLLIVEPICSTGFRLCRNGQCINSAKFCDNKTDCSDGSDEDKMFCRQCDPLSKRCEVHNGQLPVNNIFQAHWACDGEDDCENGFDESQCFGNALECGGMTYQCKDDTKIIPKAFMCDKEKDCKNGDDEDNCLAPTFVSNNNSLNVINSRKGEDITLTCQATGKPLPQIIWRFNWGCLTDEKRMVATQSYINCFTTVSTLKISNSQPGDDGIYSCEALGASQRAWSSDYQLFLNTQN